MLGLFKKQGKDRTWQHTPGDLAENQPISQYLSMYYPTCVSPHWPLCYHKIHCPMSLLKSFIFHLLLIFGRNEEQAPKFPHLTLKINQDISSSWSQVSPNFDHTPNKLLCYLLIHLGFSFNVPTFALLLTPLDCLDQNTH